MTDSAQKQEVDKIEDAIGYKPKEVVFAIAFAFERIVGRFEPVRSRPQLDRSLKLSTSHHDADDRVRACISTCQLQS